MDELREFRHGLDEMRIDQISDPLRGFLADFGSQLDFENTVWEQFLFVIGDLLKRVVDADIHTTPVSIGTVVTVKVVFSHHGQLGIEGYTDTGVSRQLERRSVVKGPHHCSSAEFNR
jgi:hypothetical protein